MRMGTASEIGLGFRLDIAEQEEIKRHGLNVTKVLTSLEEIKSGLKVILDMHGLDFYGNKKPYSGPRLEADFDENIPF